MGKKEKEYKITYKLFYNDRLKKSLFHTKMMYPLYVQIIYGRIPITFKSYYYDLFTKSKYAIRVAGKVYSPDIKEIIEKEEALIEFIIKKNAKEFSFDLFKKEYAYYSRDLLNLMEEDFLDYLYTFLQDEGLSYLADAIKKGATDIKLYELVQDFKKSLSPSLYKKLIENSFFSSPPYLPLYAFALQPKRTPLVTFNVMEWEQPETEPEFITFFRKHYPGYDVTEAVQKIKKLATV